MTVKVALSQDAIYHHVHATVTDLCACAEKLRLLGVALERSAGELLPNAPAEELRQGAAVVKAHALGALLGITEAANKAERLEAIADICDALDCPEGTTV
jgi:hypothetical protein